jgi:hypothetical protein
MATDQVFTVSLKLLKPIIIVETKPLLFADTIITSGSSDFTVHTNDPHAAKFNIAGSANKNVDTMVVEEHIAIVAPKTSKPITVDGFTVRAPVALNGQGKGTISVGGTAHVGVDSENGDYMGAATLRVVYQ